MQDLRRSEGVKREDEVGGVEIPKVEFPRWKVEGGISGSLIDGYGYRGRYCGKFLSFLFSSFCCPFTFTP